MNNRETLDIVKWVTSIQEIDRQTLKNVIVAAQERLANMQLQSQDFFSFCIQLASQEKDIDMQLQLLYNSSIFLVHQPILQ